MQLTISGMDTNLESITFSEIAFGRRPNEIGEPYTFTVEIKDFIQRFRPIYNDCILELIRDDRITAEFHPPYLGAKGYPSLEEFLCLPEDSRMEMIESYFKFDILRLYIKEDAVGLPVQWLINSLTSFSICGSTVLISGHSVKF